MAAPAPPPCEQHPLVAALSRPEALQPSAASASHVVQLLGLSLAILRTLTSPPAAAGSRSANSASGGGASDEAVAAEAALCSLISHPQLLRVLRAHLRTGDPPAALPAARLLALLLSIPCPPAPSAATGAPPRPFRPSAVGKGGQTTASGAPSTMSKVLRRLHAGVLATGPPAPAGGAAKGGPTPSPLIGDLWGMLRAQDPLLTPPCVAALHALSCGPCASLAGTVFVWGDSDDAGGHGADRKEGQGTQGTSSSADADASPLLFILRKLFATAQHRGSAEALLACLCGGGSREGRRWAVRHAAAIAESFSGSAWIGRELRTAIGKGAGGGEGRRR